MAAIAILLPAALCHGQGTSGILPDPIATNDLDRYAALLNLSSQQRQAIDPMHSAYLEQFASFRENEVGDFLDDTRNLRRSLMNPDGGADISKTTRDHKRLSGRIASMDSALFNQIQTVLSEEQLTNLPRVRMARQRQRYSTDATRFVTGMNPSVRVDLFALIHDLEFSPDDVVAIDVPLRRYESQLTDNLKSLHAETSGMFERISQSVQETVGTIDQSDPEQMRSMFEAFRTAWEQATIEVNEVASNVSSLNRNTFENMTPLLSDNGRRSLQRNFYRRAYSTGFRNSGAADRRFDSALQLTDLSDETRSAIGQLRADYEVQFRTIASPLMDAIDEQRERRGGMQFRFGRNGNDDDPGVERINDLRDRLGALEDRTLEQLNTLLGAERVAAIEAEHQAVASETTSGDFVVMTSPGAGGGASVVTFSGNVDLDTAGAGVPTDQYVPGPISRNDLDFYVESLKTDEELQVIIDSIYDEYRESYQQIVTEYIEPLNELTQNTWNFRRRGRGNDIEGPSPADVDRIFALRREAMNETQSMDEKFFADIAVLLPGDDTSDARMRRVRQSRQRDVYNRGETGSGAMLFGGASRFRLNTGGQEERVDLTRALRDVEFEGDNQTTVEALLNSYSDAMTDALRDQYETSLVFAEAMQRAMADMLKAQREASDGDEDGNRRRFRFGGERMREVNEQFGERRSQTTEQVVNLNRSTVDQLRGALPEAAARDVRDAYYQAAFPSVYADRSSARHQLDGAMELPNLTASQRSGLLDISAEYRGQYEEINLEMVRGQLEQPADNNRDAGDGQRRGRDWQRMQEIRNEMERLRFSRDELNEKTRRRIRTLLNQQQIDQVRGLADDTDEN